MHRDGFNEARLFNFAVRLANQGYAVVLPDIASLKHYEIDPTAIDQIEQTALYTLNGSGLVAADDRIALFGFSFAGGLCLSAGTRDSIRYRLSDLFAFGGYGDLEEAMTYLVDGRLPDGSTRLPHVYGQAVVARLFADQLVPAEQAGPLRAALLEYLDGNQQNVRGRLEALPLPARELVRLCLDGQGQALGERLGQQIRKLERPAALSPVRSSGPSARAFILNGANDNVIPCAQAQRLATWAGSTTEVDVLVTPLIQHVEPAQDSNGWAVGDCYRMVRFWTELLRA